MKSANCVEMHVLSACKEALARGRYTWRHNQVLGKIVNAVKDARKVSSAKKPEQAVKSWKSKWTQRKDLLGGASDWKIVADLPGRRSHPSLIQESNCRPDIVLTSEEGKTCIIIQLTVPYESNMSERHEAKMAKYEELCSSICHQGLKTLLFAVEVGARGFCGTSAYNLLKQLGLPSQQKTRYVRAIAEAAERASYWIWLKRNDKEWSASINS